jgi:hypothetical protein
VGNEFCQGGSSELYFEWQTLPAGKYRLEETDVDGSHAAMDAIEFEIDAGHQDFHAPTIENQLLDGTLLIEKKYYFGGDWVGPDVNFEIYNCGFDDPLCGSLDFLAATATIAAGTSQVTVDLPEGNYLVREIAPQGYTPWDGVGEQTATIYAGANDAEVIFLNTGDGCTPGFWQGGNGSQLWNELPDLDWPDRTLFGGTVQNPYEHDTKFNNFLNNDKKYIFLPYEDLGLKTMYDLVSTGGGSSDYQKAARNVVAAYLNASWGMGFPYTPSQVASLWNNAVNGNPTFLNVHLVLGEANSTPNTCPVGK